MKTSTLERHIEERLKNDKFRSGYPFVTISREAGSRGRTVAAAICSQTDDLAYMDLYRGWRVCDRDVSEDVAADPNFHVSLNALLAEEYHSEIQEFMTGLLGGPAEQYKVYRMVFGIIRSLAVIGKVVIIGRAGNLVTKNLKGGIHIRLTAPEEIRTRRMMELFHVDEHDAKKMLKKQDHDRAKLVKDYFSKDINDPSLYDAVWNTSESSVDEIASDAVERIREKGKAIGRA